MAFSRRGFLAGLAASLPAAANAQVRPRPRPAGHRLPPPEGSAQAILSDYNLQDITGFALRDLSNGRVVEEHNPRLPLPPASVSKVATTLYGFAALGENYRFRTRVAVDGPVQDGMLRGDLYLIGDGDPHMDTDGLADLASQVAAAGIHRIEGTAYVFSGALPYHAEIDPEQPVYVGYNPSISGLNLNFNRVHFEWKPNGGQYNVAMTARSARFDPAVSLAEIRVVDRNGPVFSYAGTEGREVWSVARGALGQGGARWLPVREPALYAAEVFRTVAVQYDLRLPDLRRTDRLPAGLVQVAEAESAAFEPMAKSMLKYSTNLTAEVLGLRAAQVTGLEPRNITESSEAMTEWLRATHGVGGARFLNHSGLTDVTRISASEMVQVLDIASHGPLHGMLKPVNMQSVHDAGCKIVAKTGTLNFARGLAGYIDGPGGRRFAFAIFSADMEARISAGSAETPRGAKNWLGRAKAQERALLERWAKAFVSA